jgi:hypothetical protein
MFSNVLIWDIVWLRSVSRYDNALPFSKRLLTWKSYRSGPILSGFREFRTLSSKPT